MLSRFHVVAMLLMGSGMCSLIYQVCWLRDFRLIFGASTAASAAVGAIFIGGLGLGGYVLGTRVESSRRPLELYAKLEMGIAISAAITPGLLWAARELYIAVGGSVVLGPAIATILRLVLATLVLVVPTFLMGGTLPAAARAAESNEDLGRRRVALLYGTNTLGAVTGAFGANFLLLEVFGARMTLWMACLVNMLVALTARALGRSWPEVAVSAPQESQPEQGPAAPRRFVYAAAAIVGFAFFLMESVWYRMLGPILGGTVFTFGLILALALLGIGLGGALYSIMPLGKRATLGGFALTCLLEAAFVIIPFALGDRVALLALQLQPLGAFGFSGQVLSWAAVGALVIVPAAAVSGYQFPLLIALLGTGRDDVGRDTGMTYAFNTIGAIVGGLAGGFGLLPLLTAPGAWRATALILLALGLAAAAIELVQHKTLLRVAPATVLGVVVGVLLFSQGPTAVWRHGSIGAGRAQLLSTGDPNAALNQASKTRRTTIWEAEGIESSVAINAENGLAFVVNGKNDGNSLGDRATQIGAGLLGAFLHEKPTSAFVIGLGTGSTAGWIGAVPDIKRVEVAELEPAIVEVARRCSAVNERAMENPKIHVSIGDARELLLTTPMQYDLIVSEPSNPYRAGIASLFTLEFYEAVAGHLAPHGLFLQWVQGYEVDALTVKTVIATLAAQFPHVEMWQLRDSDLLLVASREPLKHDLARLREKLGQEPYRSGFIRAWGVADVDSLFGHYVARPEVARLVAEANGRWLNTDDMSPVEFGFARSVGRSGLFSIPDVLNWGQPRQLDVPVVTGGTLDLERLHAGRMAIQTLDLVPSTPQPGVSAATRARAQAHAAYLAGRPKGGYRLWKEAQLEPVTLVDASIAATLAIENGDDPTPALERLAQLSPLDALAIKAVHQVSAGQLPEATETLLQTFAGMRQDPWGWAANVVRALASVSHVAERDPALGKKLFDGLAQPFLLLSLEEERLDTRLRLARILGVGEACVQLFAPIEPHVPWRADALLYRLQCYREHAPERVNAARLDLERFESNLAEPFSAGLGL